MEAQRNQQTFIYESIVGLIGLVIGVAYIPGLLHTNLFIIALFFALGVYMEARPVPLGKVISSLIVSLPVGVMVVYGGACAIWVMLVAAIAGPIVNRAQTKRSTMLFNAGQYAVSTFVMIEVYHAVAPGGMEPILGWNVFLGVLLGAAAFLVVNHTFLHTHLVFRGSFQLSDIWTLFYQESIVFLVSLPFSYLMIALSPGHPFWGPVAICPVVFLSQTLRMYQRMSVMQTIHASTGKLTAEFDVERICEEAAKTAQELTFADPVMVYVLDEPSRTLLPHALCPSDQWNEAAGFVLREEDGGVIWQVIHDNAGWVYVPDTRKDSRVRWVNGVSSSARNHLSMAIFPMQSHGVVQGAIVCYSQRAYAFGDTTEYISVLAGQVAVLVENAKLYQRLQEQSWKDGATGLYNYRFFYEALSRRMQQAAERRTPLSVAIVDVDYFKKVNDTYGHLAGDRVLQSVGELLVNLSGPEALVARYGGEEFGIILPHTAEDTHLLMESIRSEVSKHVVDYHGYRLQGITVSIGIASYPNHGMDDREILFKADSAMYWGAKERGRNRVAVYSPQLDAQLFVDELTGLFTHHYVNVRVREKFARGVRNWGMICLDISGFSHVNNTFGFDTGDKVLVEMSMLLRECIRQDELACRFGGDEFLVLLPGMREDETNTIRDRIVKTLSSHAFRCSSQVVLSIHSRSASASYEDLQDEGDLFDRVGELFAALNQVSDQSLA